MPFLLKILPSYIIFKRLIILISLNGGSKKIKSNFFFILRLLVKKSKTDFSIIKVLFLIFNLLIFLFNIVRASLLFSTKIVFVDPLDMHSSPKDPVPENKSRIFVFSKLLHGRTIKRQ